MPKNPSCWAVYSAANTAPSTKPPRLFALCVRVCCPHPIRTEWCADRTLLLHGWKRWEVEEAVDHVAVPPGDGAADAAEDDAVGDELVNFIQVEAVVSCCP